MLPDLMDIRRPQGASPVPQSLLRGRTGGYSPGYHATEGGKAPRRGTDAMSHRRPQATPEQRRRNERIQRQLDEALEDSFPASDPVSIVTSQDEEDWGADADEPDKTEAPGTKEPSAPKSSRPDSPS